VRAFAILCDHLGHPPSVDVFLYFFKAKKSGKKLWLSFNGVAGRVLLTIFEQSYKGFKKKFLKICCSIHDPTLLDDFPLYWVEKPGVKKPKSLEELTPSNRETCQLLSNLGVVFDTAELIKLEFCAKALKRYIGTFTISASSLSLLLLVHFCQLHVALSQLLTPCCFYADMTLNKEKKKKLADLLAKRRAAAAGVGTSTPPPSATSTPNSSEPASGVNKLKGVVVATGTEDKDTSSGLVFKRQKVGDVEVPSHSATYGRAPSFRDNLSSAFSPHDLIVHEGGGRALLKIVRHLPLSSSPPSSNKPLDVFKTKRW